MSLGQTDLEVSRIGLGLAALGRPGYINLGHGDDLSGETDVDSMRAHAHAVLDAAYASGVRYFDAARSYGLAEQFLGSWLQARGLGRGELTVGSKWGYRYTADWRVDAEVNEVKDLSIETLRRQEHESQALLGNTLALYQIHSATIESGVLSDRAVLDELARLRTDGLRIGFTSTGPNQSETIERALATGALRCRPGDLQPARALRRAGARGRLGGAGLGVIIKEAVANGRLTARGDVPALLSAAADRGVTPDALALAFVLAQPWVDVGLSGASTAPMLASATCRPRDVAWDPAVGTSLAGVVESPQRYWQRRSALAWN